MHNSVDPNPDCDEFLFQIYVCVIVYQSCIQDWYTLFIL